MPASPNFTNAVNQSDKREKDEIIEEEKPTATNINNLKNVWKSYDITAGAEASQLPTGRLPADSNVLSSQQSPPSQYS